MTLSFQPMTDPNHNIRKLKLTAKEGVTNSKGVPDKRLFTGENNLFAVMDSQSTLWSFKYEKGQIPLPLQSQYTSFQGALKEAKIYFNNRNVEITEIE